MGSGRLRVATAEPGRLHYESFCICWRGERTDQITGMSVLECSPFDPFLLIDICFTIAELQHVGKSFPVLAVELERASVFLPLYWGLTHSPLHICCWLGTPTPCLENVIQASSGVREEVRRRLSRLGPSLLANIGDVG